MDTSWRVTSTTTELPAHSVTLEKGTPVFKRASRSDPAIYRPVSLTCICCKLLEHIVNRHILNHLDEHKILADS